MAGTAKHYFAGGNTAVGPYILFESAFQGLDYLFVLTGGPGTGKSQVIEKIAEDMQERGYHVQLFHCPSDSARLDGLIINDLQVGLVDGTACRMTLTGIQGTIVKHIDLDKACDFGKIDASGKDIASLENQIKAAYSQSYQTFAKALRIHDEWEKYYIGSMIFAEANKVTQELTRTLYGERMLSKKAMVRHMFLGAATPEGAVDFVPNLTEDCERRIFVKGRPGSGKSTMLKKLVSAAEDRGIDVDVFHCGFDPNSLDMLIFPELSVAIFDSTAPHEHFPSRDGDEILDMYERTMETGTDERYAEPLAEIKARYAATMQEATGHLAKAKDLRDQLRGIYGSATNYAKVERLRETIEEELDRLIKVAVAK